jgi:ABC-type multidrug transport system fused ATPase/permease subunit
MTFLTYMILYIVTSFCRSSFIGFLIVNSTTNMHNEMTKRIAKAPVRFYDKNPIGRILTRFSKDIVTLD